MRRIILISLTAIVVLSLLLVVAVRVCPQAKIKETTKETMKKKQVEVAPIPAMPKYTLEPIKLFSFSKSDDLSEWEDKVFKGKVLYTIEKEKDLSYVKAKSESSASALYYKIKADARHREPILRWRWRVDKFPTKSALETIETADEHDFAGRVYVVFPAMFILNSQVLEYIWAKDLPAGTTGTSPYSKNIKLMILESGSPKDGNFVSEERDVVADYRKAFGSDPEHDIGAVAIMTNAEHTKTSAEASYDEIELGYKER